jgi:hypothetical protein
MMQYLGTSTALSLSRFAATVARPRPGPTTNTASNYWQQSPWGHTRHLSQSARIKQDQERRAATILRMVLTTPESIIEQASTEKLIDILIDESVRTSARRPIMMQVCESIKDIYCGVHY